MEGIITIVYLIVIIAAIAGLWKTFEKAGEPGWAAIVPIYNIFIMTKIAGKPAWYIVLLLIPIVNIIGSFLIFDGLAKSFGKSTGFTLGLVFLGFIFFPILGFGDAQYQGAGGNTYDDVLDS